MTAEEEIAALRAENADLRAAGAASMAENAVLKAALAEAQRRIGELEARVAQLVRQLESNSSNSNKPPSSDGPRNRAERRAHQKQSGKQKGGQPGHRGTQRALLPANQVDDVVDHYPPECESCWKPLPKVSDPSALRHQTTELPPVKPHTTEHRYHAVQCSGCAHRTSAPFAPPPTFGPRLCAVVALLTGVYHLSRRSTVSLLSDLVGVRMSLGAVSAIEGRVSEAVKPAVEEAWQKVDQQQVKHTDGTTWFQSGSLCALWTIATTAATVFVVLTDGKAKTLEPLFGKKVGVLVSDRATALGFWAMKSRQVCWAHLLRKFIAFSGRGGTARALGDELLDYMRIMFTYWDDAKTGRIDRAEFRRLMAPLRKGVEAALRRGVDKKIHGVSGSCADILKHAEALWTFVERDDVEPTNNHAERELRAFVLWRKRSYGTQSERGNRYAERLMTIAHTARKQGADVLSFLVACCTAKRTHGAAPSLFAA